MHEDGHAHRETFHENRFSVGQVHGPLTLATLEAIDDAFDLSVPCARDASHAAEYQFWFGTEYLHHLLSLTTDPATDHAVETGIIQRRLALAASGGQAGPFVRTVRVRMAVVPAGQAVELAVGRVAEQPAWTPRAPDGDASLLPQSALQHLVRRRDMEAFLLARSLLWIELVPSRGDQLP